MTGSPALLEHVVAHAHACCRCGHRVRCACRATCACQTRRTADLRKTLRAKRSTCRTRIPTCRRRRWCAFLSCFFSLFVCETSDAIRRNPTQSAALTAALSRGRWPGFRSDGLFSDGLCNARLFSRSVCQTISYKLVGAVLETHKQRKLRGKRIWESLLPCHYVFTVSLYIINLTNTGTTVNCYLQI